MRRNNAIESRVENLVPLPSRELTPAGVIQFGGGLLSVQTVLQGGPVAHHAMATELELSD